MPQDMNPTTLPGKVYYNQSITLQPKAQKTAIKKSVQLVYIINPEPKRQQTTVKRSMQLKYIINPGFETTSSTVLVL